MQDESEGMSIFGVAETPRPMAKRSSPYRKSRMDRKTIPNDIFRVASRV